MLGMTSRISPPSARARLCALPGHEARTYRKSGSRSCQPRTCPGCARLLRAEPPQLGSTGDIDLLGRRHDRHAPDHLNWEAHARHLRLLLRVACAATTPPRWRCARRTGGCAAQSWREASNSISGHCQIPLSGQRCQTNDTSSPRPGQQVRRTTAMAHSVRECRAFLFDSAARRPGTSSASDCVALRAGRSRALPPVASPRRWRKRHP